MSFLDNLFGRHYEKKAKENQKILFFSNITVPFGTFWKVDGIRNFYREGIDTFLLGYPNASLLIMASCLEMALKKKYEEVESKKPTGDMQLYSLLGWLESKKDLVAKEELDIPHGFRILRNFVTHKHKRISESDAAEGIKYISKFLNGLFPYENINMSHNCYSCGKTSKFTVDKKKTIIGKKITLHCQHCKNEFNQSGSFSNYEILKMI